jgi:hypothetical protein
MTVKKKEAKTQANPSASLLKASAQAFLESENSSCLLIGVTAVKPLHHCFSIVSTVQIRARE